MNKNVVEKELNETGKYLTITKGISMNPLFHEACEQVVIEKSNEYKNMDVVLFKRDNGEYVLHRIVKTTNDYYLISGDNLADLEKVYKRQILGVMTSFYRNDKNYKLDNIGYKLYVLFYCRPYYIRIFYIKVRNKIKSLFKR